MRVYLICSALLVFLLMALAFNVSRLRGRTRTGIGAGDDPNGPLNKAVRAHGNAAEYVPLFVALFLYFSLSAPHGWIPWVVAIATAARFLHAAGMLLTRTFDGPPQPLRVAGAAVTWACGIALGIGLLLRATV